MLSIYVKTTESIVHINDHFFDTHTYSKVLESDDLIRVLEEVENVSYLGYGKIESKFNKEPVGLSNISTGCKTLLNIISYPEKIFDITECGYNVLQRVFRLSSGKVYCREKMAVIDDISNDFMIIADSSIIVNSMKEVREWWDDYEVEV